MGNHAGVTGGSQLPSENPPKALACLSSEYFLLPLQEFLSESCCEG